MQYGLYIASIYMWITLMRRLDNMQLRNASVVIADFFIQMSAISLMVDVNISATEMWVSLSAAVTKATNC